jgi:hypothetical protein
VVAPRCWTAPGSAPSFARAGSALKKGGTMGCEGIVLTPITKPRLRLAADNTKPRGRGMVKNIGRKYNSENCSTISM